MLHIQHFQHCMYMYICVYTQELCNCVHTGPSNSTGVVWLNTNAGGTQGTYAKYVAVLNPIRWQSGWEKELYTVHYIISLLQTAVNSTREISHNKVLVRVYYTLQWVGLVEEACMESPQFYDTRDGVGARVRFHRTKWMFPFFRHMFPLRLRVHFVDVG